MPDARPRTSCRIARPSCRNSRRQSRSGSAMRCRKPLAASWTASRWRRSGSDRSEEHTSELQSLHDALRIGGQAAGIQDAKADPVPRCAAENLSRQAGPRRAGGGVEAIDRKSTRLNSSPYTTLFGSAAKLPEFKTPKQIRFRDALPKTSRGKLDRVALAEEWKR